MRESDKEVVLLQFLYTLDKIGLVNHELLSDNVKSNLEFLKQIIYNIDKYAEFIGTIPIIDLGFDT